MENKIREYRRAAGLTQWQLAKIYGTSQTRIWQWEHDCCEIAQFRKQKIAAILKADILAIFPGPAPLLPPSASSPTPSETQAS